MKEKNTGKVREIGPSENVGITLPRYILLTCYSLTVTHRYGVPRSSDRRFESGVNGARKW